jgi:hypothetical protein
MTENEQEKKPEEVAFIEEWINGFVVPVAAAIAAIPGLSPQERAVVLDHALRFPAPPVRRAAKAAPGPAAEQKPKEAPAAPAPAAPAQGAMEPLKPDAGNSDAALSRALEALEWRPAKNGKGEWIFVLDRVGKVEDAFTRTPLRDFLERVKAAPSESGLIFGGYRYRLNERFLHRWPLKHA